MRKIRIYNQDVAMGTSAHCLLAIVSVSVMFATGRAAERIETTNRAGIKLSFIPEAKLNEVELRQVLSLARRVGITNIAEVSTGYALPAVTRLVSVTGKERVNGRNIFSETVTVHRHDWGGWGKPKDAIQSGNFWVEAPSYYKRLERTYEINGSIRRIELNETDIPAADIAIPLIAARKVQFKDDIGTSTGFENISLMQPAEFRKSSSTIDYELWLHDSHKVIHFHLDKGRVIITRIGAYAI